METVYDEILMKQPAHLILKLDTDQPIELSAFVGAFTSLANEYERFVSLRLPNTPAEAQIFVREVRAGCVEADLIPLVMPLLLGSAENVMFLEDFVRRWGGRMTALINGVRKEQPATKSEMKDFADAVSAIAQDPKASATLSAATYHDGIRKVRASFKFTSADARKAQQQIENRSAELSEKQNENHQRVLMVFTRTDVGSAQIGKRSGERAKVESLHDKPLAVMYGSELAENQIKHEIREADENAFKKAFVVDVTLMKVDGKPSVFAITNLHQVIDLED